MEPFGLEFGLEQVKCGIRQNSERMNQMWHKTTLWGDHSIQLGRVMCTILSFCKAHPQNPLYKLQKIPATVMKNIVAQSPWICHDEIKIHQATPIKTLHRYSYFSTSSPL